MIRLAYFHGVTVEMICLNIFFCVPKTTVLRGEASVGSYIVGIVIHHRTFRLSEDKLRNGVQYSRIELRHCFFF